MYQNDDFHEEHNVLKFASFYNVYLKRNNE